MLLFEVVNAGGGGLLKLGGRNLGISPYFLLSFCRFLWLKWRWYAGRPHFFLKAGGILEIHSLFFFRSFIH